MGDRPQLHRRRSSLPNIKVVPLTMAQRRNLARQKRKEEEERQKLEAAKAAEEKRKRAKELRNATRTKAIEHRRKVTIMGNLIHCRYCDAMIDQMEFDDHKVSHPTHIRDRIWLGNAENSKDIEVIKKCKITHILNCTIKIDLAKNVSKRIKSFKRISIQDKESETILDYINQSNKFIEKALGDNKLNVLFIHCREGRSRSVSFLCAYLMWKEKITFHGALSDITSKRHIVLPNNKFYRELELFDKDLIKDRKQGNCRKYGKPDTSFKTKKLLVNDGKSISLMQQKHDQIVPKNNTDEVKLQCIVRNDSNSNRMSSRLMNGMSPISMTKNGSVEHRRRSSSMSGINGTFFEHSNGSNPLSPNNFRINTKAPTNGTSLSSVKGSPSTKKQKYQSSDPWKDIDDDDKLKKKKKKSNKKKKKKDEFDVEEAMDVTDIFPTDQNKKKKKKNGSKKKKKKASGSKKKKKSKKSEK